MTIMRSFVLSSTLAAGLLGLAPSESRADYWDRRARQSQRYWNRQSRQADRYWSNRWDRYDRRDRGRYRYDRNYGYGWRSPYRGGVFVGPFGVYW
jgi:hypothetical protein